MLNIKKNISLYFLRSHLHNSMIYTDIKIINKNLKKLLILRKIFYIYI